MERNFIFGLLKEKCESIVKYNMLYPDELVVLANDYLNKGCKTRKDYELLVIESINNTAYRDYLLNN